MAGEEDIIQTPLDLTMAPTSTKIWMLRIVAGLATVQNRSALSLRSNNHRNPQLARRAGESPTVVAFSHLSWSTTKCHADMGKIMISVKKNRYNMFTLWNDYHDEIDQSSNNTISQLLKPNRSTAIILNMNARQVTPDFISIASEVVGESNVFVTETAEDATLAARTVVRGASPSRDVFVGGEEDSHNYSLVIPVGGDGTLSGWINAMVDEILLLQKLGNNTIRTNMSVEDAMKKLPFIGYLPMGTGNGLGYVVGCKHGSQVDNNEIPTKSFLSRINLFTCVKRRKLQHAREVFRRLKEVGDAIQQAEQMNPKSDVTEILSGICSIVEMPMMEVTHQPVSSAGTDTKGDLCFFAGAGFDSLMLHDFQQIKAWSQSATRLPTFVKEALSSVAGYCVALITKTLPQTLRYGTHKIHVKVATNDKGTLWVDHRRGDFSELAIRSNDHIYSGTTGIIAASTTPYYGGGLRLFPYARLIPDKLHLRIGRISPLVGFFNIPQIFEGSYREKSERSFGCLDFIGNEFEVELRSERYGDYVRNKSRRKRDREQSSWLPWRNVRNKHREDVRGGNENDEQRLFSDGFPFQHSGESVGVKDWFHVRLVNEPITFISFLEPRVIIDK